MTNEKMEQRLAAALKKTAPDDVNGVLSRCEERKGTVIPMTTKKTANRKWTSLIAACLAVMLLGGGGVFYQRANADVYKRQEYNAKEKKTFEDILDFHVTFERIHPFQDGNGRVGRLIMFKECLKYNIVPFIIEDNLKMFYYRGLKEWNNEKGYLTDTCLTAQDKYKAYLDYFRIAY